MRCQIRSTLRQHTDGIRHLFNTLLLVFSVLLMCGNVWAQSTPNDAETQASTQAPTQALNEEAVIVEEGDEETPQLPPKPQRLPSHLARPTFPKDNQGKMKMLEQNLKFQKVEWLQSEKEPFLAIWQEDRSGEAKGAILIIHAEGEHPSWPQTTKPLHDSLPDYGWATMAVNLPDPLTPYTPPRTLTPKVFQQAITPEASDTESEDQTTEPEEKNNDEKSETTEANNSQSNISANLPKEEIEKANREAKDNGEEKYQIIENESEQRLVAAMKFLHDKGQFNIVIMGSGVGAIRVHQFIKSITPVIEDEKLKEKIEKPIRASIILNAKNQHPFAQAPYKDWFFDPDIPILDIYTNNAQNRIDARVRKALGKKKKAIAHSQIKLSELSYETTWRENRLSRRIRSFLDAYVQGIEVDQARINKNNN